MLFNLKSIIPEGSDLFQLTQSSRGEQEFLVDLLKRKKVGELHAILEEVKRYKAKVGTISDHLILRNSQTIIEQAQVMKELLSKNSSSELHFENASERITSLNESFLTHYDQMDKGLQTLEGVYETRRLASRYLKFLELKNQLVDTVSKPFDVEKASEMYKRCIESLQPESFQGLKFFDEAKDQVENSKTLISSECTTKLIKALDELSFTESRIYLFAFDHLQLMQIKIQEIANKAMRDNFSLIKEMFTDNLQLDSKNFKASLEGFFPRIEEVFAQIVRQSQRVWILEVSFFERMRSIKEKDLVSLFMLYFGKLINMIVQTFQKLVENKTKLPVNHEVIFLSSPIILKSIMDLVNKLYLFMIAHPTGNHQNQTTIDSLQEIVNKELPSLIEKEFEIVFSDKMDELAEVRGSILEEIQSPSSPVFNEGILDDLDNYFRLILLELQSYPARSHMIIGQVSSWFQEIFDSTVSLMNPEESHDDTFPSEHPQPNEISTFSRLYKMFYFLSHLSQHLSSLVLALPETEIPVPIEDLLNNLSAMMASLGKRFVQAAADSRVMGNRELLEIACSDESFVVSMTSLVDCRHWSTEELWVLQFLVGCRVNIAKDVAEFTGGRTQIDGSVSEEFNRVMDGYEPEDAEVYLVNQLRLLPG